MIPDVLCSIVDRILRKQKEDQEIAAAAAEANSRAASKSTIEYEKAPQPAIPPRSTRQQAAIERNPGVGVPRPSIPDALDSVPQPYAADKENSAKPRIHDRTSGLISIYKKKLTETLGDRDRESIAAGSDSSDMETLIGLPSSSAGSGPSRSWMPIPGVTPRSTIDSVVNQAIQRCLPEQQSLFQSRSETNWVKEASNEAYCGISGRGSFCRYIGERRL